ncbi:MAG: UMP kinase [Rectinemataceae bacterium]|nr:UMP kinase [Spirochaetaceae bacterium]
MIAVISLGGSILAPKEGPDAEFLIAFKQALSLWLDSGNHKAIIVVGGGAPARIWQQAYRTFIEKSEREKRSQSDSSEPGRDGAAVSQTESALMNAAFDRIGIAATRLNAQLIREVFGDLCPDPVVTDPTADIEMRGRVLVGAGWKPGFSTDYDAVLLAERFGADSVINLSNVTKIHDDDPRKNPHARPLDRITFDRLLVMTGEHWNPGANVPFDPIAARKARDIGLRIIFAHGRNLENFLDILFGRPYIGTVIQDSP